MLCAKKYLRAFPPYRELNVFLAKKFFLKINKIRNAIRIPARHILFINTRPAPHKNFYGINSFEPPLLRQTAQMQCTAA